MIQLLLFILIGFGITTIITKSTIFEPLRDRLDTGGESIYNNFWGLLIICPLCVGFWIGVVESFMFGSLSANVFSFENSSYLSGFFNNILYGGYFIFTKIADGAIVSCFSWFIHSYIAYLDSAYEYNQTMDTYYQLKGEDFVKSRKSS